MHLYVASYWRGEEEERGWCCWQHTWRAPDIGRGTSSTCRRCSKPKAPRNTVVQRSNGIWNLQMAQMCPWLLLGVQGSKGWEQWNVIFCMTNLEWDWLQKDFDEIYYGIYVLSRLCSELHFMRVWGETCCTTYRGSSKWRFHNIAMIGNLL